MTDACCETCKHYEHTPGDARWCALHGDWLYIFEIIGPCDDWVKRDE